MVSLKRLLNLRLALILLNTMTRVLRHKLDPKIENLLWQRLLREIQKVNSVADFKNFFDKFLTKDERVLILRRLAIMELIENKKKYREIKDILDVSGNTISAVKDVLLGKGYKKRIIKTEKKRSNFSARTRVIEKSHFSKFPTYSGKGRWSFLNM